MSCLVQRCSGNKRAKLNYVRANLIEFNYVFTDPLVSVKVERTWLNLLSGRRGTREYTYNRCFIYSSKSIKGKGNILTLAPWNPLKYIDVKTKSMIWIYEDTEGEDEGEDEDVIVEVWIALCWCKWRRKPVWKVAWAFAYASMQIKGLSEVMHLHRDISDAMGTREPGNPALSPLVNREPWPGPSVPLERKSRKFIWPIAPSENGLRGEMMFFRV